MTKHTKTSHNPRPNGNQGVRGVIMVIMLLAVTLLAGLLFYVLNMGQQTNGRVVTQNSADAAAVAGAGYVARTFNTVAMNNMGITQYLSAIAFIDSYPMAVDFTLQDEQAFSAALHAQLNRGIPDQWVRETIIGGNPQMKGSTPMLQGIDDQVALLMAVNQGLTDGTYGSGFDIRTITMYQVPAGIGGGKGQMWRAIDAMSFYSQAAVANLGSLAQVNAVQGGQVDLDSGHALLVPVLPNIPIIHGMFDDFERPVKNGLLPARDPFGKAVSLIACDDKITNRGPWDTALGWRHPVGGGVTGFWTGGSNGGANLGKGAGFPGEGGINGNEGAQFVQTGSDPPDAYEVEGPLQYMGNRTGDFATANLYYTRFAHYVDVLTKNKLAYLWPPPPADVHKAAGNLICRGYRHANDADPAWEIPLVKDYKYWFDGPNMLRDDHPSEYFYLEDGVNTTSDDLVLRLQDLGDGTMEVMYISQATQNWRYDIVDSDGNIVLGGLGQGVNGRRTNSYSTIVPAPPYQITRPQWITDYNAAYAIANPPPPQANAPPPPPPQHIVETAFVHVGIRSRFKPNEAGFLSAGSWVYDNHDNTDNRVGAQVIWHPGWLDMEQVMAAANAHPNPNLIVTRINDFIWQEIRAGTELFDSEIGITQQIDADGNPVPQPVYAIDQDIFIGVNVGTFVDIRNPYNTGRHELLPAPFDLDHTKLTPSVKDRRQYLSFLGVARRSDQALMAPTKFTGNKPYANMVAIAQAQVFNNHSFDLWTPMWGSQIQAVDDYAGWVNTLDAGIPDAANVADGVLNNAGLADLTKYLRANEALANLTLSH